MDHQAATVANPLLKGGEQRQQPDQDNERGVVHCAAPLAALYARPADTVDATFWAARVY
jgi:hypothetical protein